MMTLHQVVHQGEQICMTKSWKVHFCWFLGFTKVALATFPKWTQSWWNLLFYHTIWPCQASWQMEIIFLPKPTSNTFWQNLKIHVLTPSTNLQELSFLPQPLLVPLYLWCASLPERQWWRGAGIHFSSLENSIFTLSPPLLSSTGSPGHPMPLPHWNSKTWEKQTLVLGSRLIG